MGLSTFLSDSQATRSIKLRVYLCPAPFFDVSQYWGTRTKASVIDKTTQLEEVTQLDVDICASGSPAAKVQAALAKDNILLLVSCTKYRQHWLELLWSSSTPKSPTKFKELNQSLMKQVSKRPSLNEFTFAAEPPRGTTGPPAFQSVPASGEGAPRPPLTAEEKETRRAKRKGNKAARRAAKAAATSLVTEAPAKPTNKTADGPQNIFGSQHNLPLGWPRRQYLMLQLALNISLSDPDLSQIKCVDYPSSHSSTHHRFCALETNSHRYWTRSLMPRSHW